jgi:AAA+ ATPase superfamily predicted ATPase
MVTRNPFIITGYHGPDLFCDREEETRTLISNAENGVNTTLTSIRRMGKTGLIWHTMRKLSESNNRICIYADVYATQNLQEFTNKIGSAIINTFPEKNPAGKRFLSLLKSLRPVITYDALSGQPQISFTFASLQQYEQSLDSLFRFLDSQNKPVLLAIDEFQQITRFPEKNMEALLRSQLQPLKYVNLIFSGSSQHLLSEMFTEANRPFFASTQFLYLQEIDRKIYFGFIREMFSKNNISIQDDVLDYILDFSRLHTFYTQSICNRLYARGIKNITSEIANQVCRQLITEHEQLFFQYRNLLTPIQWNLMKAVAKEGKVYQPNSKGFIEKYKIGIPANVQRAIKSLLNKEMIYKGNDDNGTFYSVYDLFLSRWMEFLD